MDGFLGSVGSGFPDSGEVILGAQGVLAFLGLFAVIDRLIYLGKARRWDTHFLLGVIEHLERKDWEKALHEVSQVAGPGGRVAYAILARHFLPRTNLREIAQEAGQLEVPQIEKGMRLILGVALVTPLLGMLGSMLGLVQMLMTVSGSEEPTSRSVLAEGMFQALNSSAVGLAIAIPCYVAYLYCYGRSQELLRKLERIGIETVNVIIDCDQRSERPELNPEG